MAQQITFGPSTFASVREVVPEEIKHDELSSFYFGTELFDDRTDLFVGDTSNLRAILQNIKDQFYETDDEDEWYDALEEFARPVQSSNVPNPQLFTPDQTMELDCPLTHCPDVSQHQHVCQPCGHTHDHFANAASCSRHCTKVHVSAVVGIKTPQTHGITIIQSDRIEVTSTDVRVLRNGTYYILYTF